MYAKPRGVSAELSWGLDLCWGSIRVQAYTGEYGAKVRGNHSSNTTCVTHAFFNSCETCSKFN